MPCNDKAAYCIYADGSHILLYMSSNTNWPAINSKSSKTRSYYYDVCCFCFCKALEPTFDGGAIYTKFIIKHDSKSKQN